ncbi:hypothetical protein V202x_32220 [Gimesia aquarii]|uniref:Uncharacterized protein n=1 Tax=Gimesia aquarii TaxID=2527964 RepID=A0A517WX30_9PLAN|nr:hypothetical protein V202x_32220 [Gimesia aquarii]
MNNGFRTLLTDQDWSSVTKAKLKGLYAYWGNPVSEHAERHLNLTGIGHLLAMSSHIELNALAAQYFRLEFGPKFIYSIRNHQPQNGKAEEKSSFKYGGRILFDDMISYEDLEKRLIDGAEIKTTLLTEEFSYDDYLEQQGETRLMLFAIDPNENIHVFTPSPDFQPKANWKIVGLS